MYYTQVSFLTANSSMNDASKIYHSTKPVSKASHGTVYFAKTRAVIVIKGLMFNLEHVTHYFTVVKV